MPLARLENFLKNLNGNTLYVDPNEIDSTDSIENRGNSRTRPFKTIQRALIEATRFSYVEGSNNDLFDQTTILISSGTHYIDNRPGYYWNGSVFKDVNNTTTTITEFSVASDMDLESPSNSLYIYNSAEGGVIIPKGVSLVATDLRKTKIRPKFVPDPANDSIAKSAIFRVTGGSYIFGFTIFDGNPSGGVYNTYTSSTISPTYSHHKLTAFEYADGKNILKNSTLTDLDNYYYKVSYGFGSFSGRPIPNTFIDLQKNPEENKIVGDLGQGLLEISTLISGDGSTAGVTITVTTKEKHNLTPTTPIQISGVGSNNSVNVQQQFNGNFVVSSVISPTSFTYLVSSPPAAASPDVNGAKIKVQSDTVNSSSPYIFNCSLKSVYGLNGIHADGSKATGFKSMVTAQFTGISLQRDDRAFVKYDETSGTYLDQNNFGNSLFLHQDSRSVYKPSWESYHIKASNDSFIQCVSIFAIGYAKHFVANSGGDQSITNSNSNFGAISLFSSGFKNYQLEKDNHAYITHIIPPKEISQVENEINCYVIDSSLTYAVNQNTRIYLKGYKDLFTPPSEKIRNYIIGAKNLDAIYHPYYSGSATITPNYERSYNINSISNNTITIEGTFSEITENIAVRVISNNAVLPDGLENNKVYYVSENSLSSNTLKLKESLSSSTDILIKNDIGIEIEDNLKLVFRVSDCAPGFPGSPFKFDSTNGIKNWYLSISANTAFLNSVSIKPDPIFYIKRKIDSRVDDDKVYRLRIVIPKESKNTSEPSPGFIIQKASNDIDSFYFRPNNVNLSLSENLSPIEIIRNQNLIVDAWTTTSGSTITANIITSKSHKLKVGNGIKIYNLKSTSEPSPVGLGTGTGFNGEFVVSEVVNNLHFKFIIDRNPGTVLTTAASSTATWLAERNCNSSSYRTPPYTIDSSNRDEFTDILPYFTCEKVNTDFQIYKVKTIQKYVPGNIDGIYHVYLNCFKNIPTSTPFNIESYKLSQNIDNIIPQEDLDNLTSNLESTVSSASRKIIGKVEVNDPKLSSTKENIIQYLKDFDGGVEVSSISKVGNTCTLTTNLWHEINDIRQLSVTNSGSGFVNGTYYNIPLCTVTGSGNGGTVNVTVSGGSVTSAVISYKGSGYSFNDRVSIKGIPGSISVVECTVLSTISENLGFVQILGSVYPENNGTFKITSVTSNTITYENSLGRTESSSTAVIIPEIPAYIISSIGAYDSGNNVTTITTSTQHPFLVGNKVLFDNSTTQFNVVNIISSTSFQVSGQILGSSPTLVCSSGLNSQNKDTDVINENIGSRHFAIPTGHKGRILNSMTDSDTLFTAVLSNTNTNTALGLNKGEFIKIDDEILLIDAVSGTLVSCIRGVLGTNATSHSANSAFRVIISTPIELRRNSILRASGHTFEYTGFGPGNYSTGMPTNQDRVLSNDEILISQSLQSHGGLIVYTGMNSNGEFFVGRKKYDAVTGEEKTLQESENQEIVTFFDTLSINKLTVNNSIDATTASSEFKSILASSLSVTGNTILGDTSSDTTTINGSLSVTGISTFSSNVNVSVGASFIGAGTIPVGGIIMWSGSIANIPTGWALCNGSSGTPDLRNRFIVAAGTDNSNVWGFDPVTGISIFTNGQTSVGVGSTGGEIAHQLTINELAEHNHTITGGNVRGDGGGSSAPGGSGNPLSGANISIGYSGGNYYHENRPPYYALAFIMRIA